MKRLVAEFACDYETTKEKVIRETASAEKFCSRIPVDKY